MSVGEYHICGLLESRELMCWTSLNSGLVGGGSVGIVQTDTPPGRFQSVSAGWEHGCGVRESGEVACWGENDDGQTDAPSGRFSAVSVGGRHSCGLRESGEVECWGYRFNGQAQPPAGRHLAISAGGHHACALSEAGTVTCWMIHNGAADVPAWLRDPVGRLADGRTELGWLPHGLLMDGAWWGFGGRTGEIPARGRE